MISLDQVLLLQKKVETAVEKIGSLNGIISQLKAENDALRSKCAELTNSLSEKSELISTFEAEQGKIEEGILSALNRLDTVENTLLSNIPAVSQNAPAAEETQVSEAAVTSAETNTPAEETISEPVIQDTPAEEQQSENTELNFTEDVNAPAEATVEEKEEDIPVPQTEMPEVQKETPPAETTISGQFDIF